MKRMTGRGPDGTAYLYNMGGTNEAIDRLAAYEDTGLEPEICAAYRTFENEAISKNVPFRRIVELMNAESVGRLLVLPCKVGDTVYVHEEEINSFYEARKFVEQKRVIAIKVENDGPWIVVDDYDSWVSYPVGSKRLFFTREEAEDALRKEQQNG